MKTLTTSSILTKAIAPVRDSLNWSAWRRSILLIALVLASLAVLPTARAVCQDGCSGPFNTVLGDDALLNNLGGTYNTAIGLFALGSNTDGGGNTANGADALSSNTTGNYNTANGLEALFSNTTGGFNTATGSAALNSNISGNSNTAHGANTLFNNTSGYNNTASGFEALNSNTTGNNNTANGYRALYGDARNPSTGSNNTATGSNALNKNTTGYFNAADGALALSNNTAGSSNIALGYSAGKNLTTGSNNIDIGNSGVAGEAKTIRIGALRIQTSTYIAGISGVTVPNGVGVIVGANGKLGTVVSSERFKHEIKPMDKASEAILALQPVTFRYKHDLDPDGIPQFGLVAEQVEKVNPDLVARDEEGKAYTVRYEAVNAMLLNEFLKEHRKVEEQEATIARVKSTLAKQEATIVQQKNDFQSIIAQQQKDFQSAVAQQQKEMEALKAGLQKVSGQLQLSRAVPQLVVNNQ
jgi:hypothetical protein